MVEEEGSCFFYVFWGSKNIFGLVNFEEVCYIQDVKGIGFVDVMQVCGFIFFVVLFVV